MARYLDDYPHVTTERFDTVLAELVAEMTPGQLFAVPGIYEALSEELNNAVLARFIPVDELNNLMDFDHVIEVHDDGTVTDAAPGIYAPELDGEKLYEPAGWRLLSGYTGQYGYNGPVMHPSEFIGGGLAKDILTEPGLYVALVVWADDPNDEPAGWAVAFRETDK